MQNCGNCTMCCKLLDIFEAGSEQGEWCTHCNPTEGCKVYTVRPDDCRTYQCAWSQMDTVNKKLRPDKSKIIFDKVSDGVFSAIQHPHYEITKTAFRQIFKFMKDGFSVVVLYPKAKKQAQMFLAKGHEGSDVWKQVTDKAEEVRNDSP